VRVKTLALIVALAASLLGTVASAQKALDAPPPLPAATPSSPAPAKPGPARRTVARLPEAERARADAPAQAPAPSSELTDDQLLPPARQAAPETLIEQKRQGNRVTEIVVTPQGSTSSYLIVNREGRPPLTTQELSSGLSTPRFLRFDF
jgi:cell division protein FtsN